MGEESEISDLSDPELSDRDAFEPGLLSASSMMKLTSNGGGPVLINKALAFTWSYMNNNHKKDSVEELVRSFTADEIQNAKSELWHACSSMKAIIGKRKQRRDSTERTKADDDAQDIVRAFQKLDAKKKVPIIMVDARDLYTLPSSTVKGKGIEERLDRLESMVREMQETMKMLLQSNIGSSPVMERLETLESTTSNMCGATTLLVQQLNESRKEMQKAPELAPIPSDQAFPPLPLASTGESGTGPVTSERAIRFNPGRPSMAEAVQRNSAPMAPSGSSTKIVPMERKKTRPLKGSGGTSTGLRGGRDTVQVQLTNVHSSIEQKDLENYVKDKHINVKSVTDISAPSGWDTKRFLITFAKEDAERVLSTDFWPDDVYFRQYIPAARRNFAVKL
jgi:hypothetical protein